MTQVTATDGRVIGTRATITRVRLLEATAKLLDENSALDLKVIDITREANTSPATFYQYFTDVSDAILDLVYQAGQDSLSMLVHLDQSWDGEAGKNMPWRSRPSSSLIGKRILQFCGCAIYGQKKATRSFVICAARRSSPL